MQLRSVISAQSFRLISIRPTYYLLDLIEAVRARYGFVGFPTTPQEILSPENPLDFLHGKYTAQDGREVVIRSMKLYAEGVVVETQTNTAEADMVLMDLLEWARRDLSLAAEIVGGGFVSQLEIGLTPSLASWFAPLQTIGALISDSLRAIGREVPPFQLYSLAMTLDPAVVKVQSDFRIEHRQNFPFRAEVYFSSAPLKTEEHIAVLERLEQLVGGEQKKEPAPEDADSVSRG